MVEAFCGFKKTPFGDSPDPNSYSANQMNYDVCRLHAKGSFFEPMERTAAS